MFVLCKDCYILRNEALSAILKLKKVKKTMTYIQEDNFPIFGTESEIKQSGESRGWNPAKWQQKAHDAGFIWVTAKEDGTPEVDVEFIIPPFPLCDSAKQDISNFFTWVESVGGKVGSRNLGGHVHMGNRFIQGNISKSQFWYNSKREYANNERYYQPSASMCQPMPLALAKDVISRYGSHQDDIDAILSPSRRHNRYSHSMAHVSFGGSSYDRFMRASTSHEMSDVIGGKFYAINMSTWSRIGTIEFRQHQATLDSKKLFAWCELIFTMFKHSDWNRLDYNAPSSTIIETPVSPFRNGSRISVLYSAMRVDGGATTRDLMNATGWSADTIRARVSEIRNREDVGQNGLICHTQQAYGSSYGSSAGQHDLNGYEVLRSMETIIAGNVATLPENRIGMTSIWAGMTDDLFEYFNARRQTLS